MSETTLVTHLALMLAETDAGFRQHRTQTAAREQAFTNAYAEFGKMLGVPGNYVAIRDAIKALTDQPEIEG